MTTADQILARVLVRCMWPSTNAPLTNDEILSLVDDEITGTCWPQLHAAQGDWHLTYEDHTLASGQSLYRLPDRAWGPVKDLLYVESDGTQLSLPVINVEELGQLTRESRPNSRAPHFAYIEGDSVGLTPVPSGTGGTLRVRYYRMPSTLTLITNARRVTSIVDKQTLTISGTIGTFDGELLDFIGQGGSHQVIATDQLATNVVGTTLNMDGEVPDSIRVGDWVALAGYTPLAQIPDHMVPQLVQRVAMQCLSAQGDQAGFVRAATMAADLEKRGLPTLDPRNEAEPRVIMPRGGLIRRGR